MPPQATTRREATGRGRVLAECRVLGKNVQSCAAAGRPQPQPAAGSCLLCGSYCAAA
jgi:hypothetical protein